MIFWLGQGQADDHDFVTRASRHQKSLQWPSVDCARLFKEFLITHRRTSRGGENATKLSAPTLNENHDNLIISKLQLKLCDILFDGTTGTMENGANSFWFLIELFFVRVFHSNEADTICCIVSETNFYCMDLN